MFLPNITSTPSEDLLKIDFIQGLSFNVGRISDYLPTAATLCERAEGLSCKRGEVIKTFCILKAFLSLLFIKESSLIT